MTCSPSLGLVAFVLINFLFNVACIAYKRNIDQHVRISRAQEEEPPITDWEIGLREAMHQALLRDGHVDPILHEHLQKASFSGKHDGKAFGDIAILARGQLYATPVGFNFVQDPYYNDCDECYNERRRCEHEPCDQHVFNGPKQLIALWTVKRIRHRDDNYGHRYEIEYTIAPVDKALSGGFITRNGRFDYGIPGHVFVIRSNPRYTNGYQHNKFFSSPDQVKWHRNFLPRPLTGQYPTILIAHAEKLPVQNIFQSSGGDVHFGLTSSTTNPKEIELYRKLLESLAAKTSTTGHSVTIEAQGTSPQKSINKVTTPLTSTKTSNQITPTISPQRTTLVQLPSGEILPLTQISTSTIPEEQFQILTPVQIGSFQTIPAPTNGFHLIPTKPFTTTDSKHDLHTESNIPLQIPSTEVPIFIMKELVPPFAPSVRPEVVKDIGSTKLPKKTTIHFFAAEDDEKSTQNINTNDEILKPTRKYSNRKKSTKATPRTITKQDYEDEEDFDLFSVVKPTETMRKITQGLHNKKTTRANQIVKTNKHTTILPATTNRTRKIFTTTERKTTIPKTTASSSSIYGTQGTILTPSTFSTTYPTSIGSQSTKLSSFVPTVPTYLTTAYNTHGTEISSFIPSTVNVQRITTRNTIFRTPTVFRTITTTQFPYTTLAPSTTESTYLNYAAPTTSEPRESIVTVTPVQTVSIGRTTYEDSTVSTTGNTENTSNTISTMNFSKLRTDSQLDNNFSRTTFVYPSTGMISTTFLPKTVFSTLGEHISSRLPTTQTYTANTESVTSTERKYNLIPISTTTAEQNSKEQTLQQSTATVSVVSTPNTEKITSIKTTSAITESTRPNNFNNDFLVEDSNEDDTEPISKDRSKNQEYTDDDIFGPSIKSKNKQFSKYKQQKPMLYKTHFTTEPTRTVAKSPKIIYSDFYEASTVPPTTSLAQFHAESNNNFLTKSFDVTTERLPLTSQSYLTSISYEVNKKNSFPTSLGNFVLPTIKAKLSNVVNNEEVQIFKAELINSAENVTQRETDKQAFDSIALQLINHARSLDLLNKKPRKEGNQSQEERIPKYKRRNLYVPKSRRSHSNKKKGEK